MTLVVRIAHFLRRYADRLDYDGAPKAMGWSFTFESRIGIVFHSDGRGCPIWYLGAADYERAHLHAGPDRAYVARNPAAVERGRPRPYPRVQAHGRAQVPDDCPV